MAILNDLKFSRRHALKGMLSGVGVSPVAAGAGRHVQRQRHRVRGGSAVAHDVRHLLLGQRCPPGCHSGRRPPRVTATPGSSRRTSRILPTSKTYMTLLTGLDMLDAEFKGHGWGVVYVLAGGDGTICNTIGGHRQVALRSATRNGQGHAVDAHHRPAGRRRHSHQRALQVPRDGHPEVHGPQHGNGEPEPRAQRPEHALAAGA